MARKLLTLILGVMIATGISAQVKTLHDFEAKTIDGELFHFSTLKGKKVLVVNTASKCGFTPQYADLQKLYEEYGGENFVIIGFPANNFMKQEPGTNEKIKVFCTKNYGVTFPMMEKISVKGDDQHPIYQWLTSKKQNGVMDSSVKWNFQKYMIDEDGQLVGVVYSRENPYSDTILEWLRE